MGFEISLFWLLIPYTIFLIIFLVYAFFNVYNLIRFGVNAKHLTAVIGVFLLGSLILLSISLGFLARYDWLMKADIISILFGQSSVPTL